jgi:membrane protein
MAGADGYAVGRMSDHLRASADEDVVRVGEARGRDADHPADIPARGWKDVLVRVKREVADDHVSLSAAGVAFFAFLSFIPALAALVSLYGLFSNPAEVERQVSDLLTTLPQESRELISGQLRDIVTTQQRTLSISLAVSIALSLWTASGAMAHLIEAINIAYDEEPRTGLRRRVLALGLTLLAIVFAVAMIAGISAFVVLVDGQTAEPIAWLLRIALWVAIAIGFSVGVAALYRFAPNRDRPRWRWVSAGSVIAVIVLVLASIGFRWYTTNFGSYNETYGSLAAIVLLLLWLYIAAFVVLLGAQINAELEHQTARDTTRGEPRPMGTRRAVMADEVAPATDAR